MNNASKVDARPPYRVMAAVLGIVSGFLGLVMGWGVWEDTQSSNWQNVGESICAIAVSAEMLRLAVTGRFYRFGIVREPSEDLQIKRKSVQLSSDDPVTLK